jgi:hypothetical protein
LCTYTDTSSYALLVLHFSALFKFCGKTNRSWLFRSFFFTAPTALFAEEGHGVEAGEKVAGEADDDEVGMNLEYAKKK